LCGDGGGNEGLKVRRARQGEEGKAEGARTEQTLGVGETSRGQIVLIPRRPHRALTSHLTTYYEAAEREKRWMRFEKKMRIGELEMRTVSWSDAENHSDGVKATGEVAMSRYQTIKVSMAHGPGSA